MKKTIYILAATAAIMTGLVLNGCQTPAQKEAAAETKVEAAKDDLKVAKQELNAEYPAFRKEADEQIADNDKKIASLREKLNKPGKHPLDNARKQKIENLEKKNAELRAMLDGYESDRTDWAAFKLSFNHAKDNVRDGFKDMGEDLKK